MFLCSLFSITYVRTQHQDDPCELLIKKLLIEFFGISFDNIILELLSSSNPSCTVEWHKPNIEELKQKHQDAMSLYMEDKMAGQDLKIPAYPGNSRVILTLYHTEFKEASSAKSSFDTAMHNLQKGRTMEVNGTTETMFQYSTEPVTDLADDAHWVEGLSQLSVLSGIRIFHLQVRVDDNSEENLKSAIAIASRLAETLQ